MLEKIKLSLRLPTVIVGAAAVMGIGVGLASYFTAANIVSTQANQKLEFTTEAAKDKFVTYFESIAKELSSVASSPLSVSAIEDFTAAWSVWERFGVKPKEELQKAYITENPHPIGEKHLLDTADTGVHYDKVHAQYHPWFRDLLESSGYYDIFMFDTKGNLVYSVFKELDYATNFSENGGEWANSGLGLVYRQAMTLTSSKQYAFEDFAPYGPSANAPASFIAAPIFKNDGSLIGVLAFQMPVDHINATFAEISDTNTGFEAFLVGADGKFRNDSPFTAGGSDILATSLEPAIIGGIFSGSSKSGVSNLHRDEAMSFVGSPFDILGRKFAIVAGMPQSLVQAPVISLGMWMAIIGVVMLVLTGAFGVYIARSITRPINHLVGDMKDLAEGNTDIALQTADKTDEIGDMSRAVVVFRDGMIEQARLEAESREQEAAKLLRQQRIDGLIETFKVTVADVLSSVENNTNAMSMTAESLNGLSENTRERATFAAEASDNASNNVQTVAAAAEELSSSIGEISRQVQDATGIVGKASQSSRDTNTKVESLAQAANKIGDVVSLISDIAEQTNLLALNATIESARAGDAGKGFAVVAQEVKALATQTSKATEEIAGQIKEIQNSTQDAVSSIDEIAKTMGDVDNYMTTISAAVEQQGLATGEISENVAQAAQGTRVVVENISTVQNATNDTASSANEVSQSAGAVNNETRRLNATIEQFLQDVAAA